MLTILEPGKIASVVTFVEMRTKPVWITEKAGGKLNLVPSPDLEWYRQFFRAVGEHWLWFSRLALSDEGLRAKLARHGAELYTFEVEGKSAGLVEMEISDQSVEIVFFGLLPQFTGRGLGRQMMAHALRRAWSEPQVARVWLHTCTLDDPAALPFYRRRGFEPYQRGIEIADDPRLTGLLPRASAPEVPLL